MPTQQEIFSRTHSSPYKRAIEHQRVLSRLIDDPSTTPKDVAACARAWDVLEDRKRELRGVPKSGQRRPSPDKPAKTIAPANLVAD